MRINIEMNKRLRIVMLVALVLVALSAQVYAHDLWLNLNDYAPVIGGHTRPVVYFGWGHKYPVDDMFDSGFLNKFQLIKSNGEVKDIKPGAGGFLATRLDIKEPGSYWVMAETFPGYADYRTPIRQLWQCGSGTHPGGGVMGMGGHNAAREILKGW